MAMKKRLREINIFSMSVVDLFACAMGAFIIVALILFPYYLKSDLTPCPPPCEEPVPCPVCPPTQPIEKKEYLVIMMSWDTNNDDIDLHVIDPRGKEYYYRKKEHPPSPALLAEDDISGPGNEIWLHPQITPGTYRVYYKYYAQYIRYTDVKGKIITQENEYEIPTCGLRRRGQKLLVATINVDQGGNIEVNTRRCS